MDREAEKTQQTTEEPWQGCEDSERIISESRESIKRQQDMIRLRRAMAEANHQDAGLLRTKADIICLQSSPQPQDLKTTRTN